MYDLWAVSSTLYELDERDEVATYTLEAARLRTSTRSRRNKTAPEELPRADHLETFIERRKEWVKNELEVRPSLSLLRYAQKLMLHSSSCQTGDRCGQ